MFLDGKLEVGAQCWRDVGNKDTQLIECTYLGKRFEETAFPSIEPVINGRGGFTNAPLIKANAATSTHRFIDRLDVRLEVTMISSTARRRSIYMCTYLGNKLVCFREHVQSATKDRVFYSLELGTIITSQGVEEVPCIGQWLSYTKNRVR